MSGREIVGPPLPDVPFRSVPQLIAARAAVEPSRPAVRARGPSGKWQDLSWSSLDARRRGIAAGLHGLGVGRGDVVAVVSPNSPEMLLAELAVLTLGAAVAPIFPGYAPDVLHHCLSDSGARVAFAGSSAQQHQLARQLDRIVVLDGRPLPETLHRPRRPECPSRTRPWMRRTTTRLPALHQRHHREAEGRRATHHNALSQQAARRGLGRQRRDVFLSYLPGTIARSLFERLMALWHRAILTLDDSRGRD
jgi:acyl-CoA synthetase (AMP-forming)/AMP-acid ligase II